jgi:hypothetical protein
MTAQSNHDQRPAGLVVIARNASGQIVTRITSRYELAGAMRTASSILKLKVNAIGAEIHVNEGPTSTYSGKPLAAIRADDLMTHHQIS